MSFSTTAAARQKEMNDSIAVVAMRTLGMDRFGACRAGGSIWFAMTQLEVTRAGPETQTAMERRAVHGRSARALRSSGIGPRGLDRALPLPPTGLADGLGLGSVLWRTSRQCAPIDWVPRVSRVARRLRLTPG